MTATATHTFISTDNRTGTATLTATSAWRSTSTWEPLATSIRVMIVRGNVIMREPHGNNYIELGDGDMDTATSLVINTVEYPVIASQWFQSTDQGRAIDVLMNVNVNQVGWYSAVYMGENNCSVWHFVDNVCAEITDAPVFYLNGTAVFDSAYDSGASTPVDASTFSPNVTAIDLVTGNDITSDITHTDVYYTSSGNYTLVRTYSVTGSNNKTSTLALYQRVTAESVPGDAEILGGITEPIEVSNINTVTPGDGYYYRAVLSTGETTNIAYCRTPTTSIDTPPALGTYYYRAVVTDGDVTYITNVDSATLVEADTTPPMITLTGDASCSLTVGDTWTDPGATATDNVDASVTVTSSITLGGQAVQSVDTSTAGTYTITYSASDAAGNAATPVTRTVAVNDVPPPVTDTTPPVITLTGDASISITVGDTWTDPGATATDDTDASVTVTTTGTVDTSTAGTYTLTYNATDAAGNVATPVTRTVTVAAASGSGSDSGSGFTLIEAVTDFEALAISSTRIALSFTVPETANPDTTVVWRVSEVNTASSAPAATDWYELARTTLASQVSSTTGGRNRITYNADHLVAGVLYWCGVALLQESDGSGTTMIESNNDTTWLVQPCTYLVTTQSDRITARRGLATLYQCRIDRNMCGVTSPITAADITTVITRTVTRLTRYLNATTATAIPEVAGTIDIYSAITEQPLPWSEDATGYNVALTIPAINATGCYECAYAITPTAGDAITVIVTIDVI